VRKDFTPFDGRAHATMRLVDFPLLEPHRLLFCFFFVILGQCGRPRNNELWSQHCRFRPTFGHPRCPPGRQMCRPHPPSSLRRRECCFSRNFPMMDEWL
jgi:hypothetical protein